MRNTLEFTNVNSGYTTLPEEHDVLQKWIEAIGEPQAPHLTVLSSKQGWGQLRFNNSIVQKPLCLAGQTFDHGLGSHANSEIVITSSQPLARLRALAGVDDNRASRSSTTEVQFSIWSGDQCLWESPPLTVLDQPLLVDLDMNGATEFTLKATAEPPFRLAHVDWINVEGLTAEGKTANFQTSETISQNLPISFVYNGLSSKSWFDKWGVKHSSVVGDIFTRHTYLTQDRETGLSCSLELEEYHDSPTCLWNVAFRNEGKSPTPLLEAVKTLDLLCSLKGEKKFLHRARGSFNYVDDSFEPEAFRDNFRLQTDVLKNTEIIIGGFGGRSSVDWMPYFNLAGVNEGLLFGIGWTGQWQSRITATDAQIRVQAGMETISLSLEPGESIRQPSILMTYWRSENPLRGNNLLRRFIQNHLLPRYNGEVVQAPASNLTWGGMVSQSHLARLENIKLRKIPFDYYWIDAGWYGKAGPNEDDFAPEWGSQAGDWSVNPETFPNGFREISDQAHQQGIKFLLWAEPERAVHGTPITLEHPEWFLGTKKIGESLLLDLGNPEARSWCIELISSLITEQGMDCYRQDFNFGPLPFWQAKDTPGRIGISEIRYVEGLYSFLDELRRRHPALLIDNCASGGRRLDFEIMRRSIPLWASDMQCFPNYLSERNLQHVSGLAHWLPQFGFGTQDHPGDTYHFRSTMAAGVNVHLFPFERNAISSDYPYDWLTSRLEEYHRAKKYFTGDFYPLLDISDSFKDWSASQFHQPELGEGILLVFRKTQSPIEKVSLELQGLIPEAVYRFEDADTDAITEISGERLIANGFLIEINLKRTSRLFYYSQVNPKV